MSTRWRSQKFAPPFSLRSPTGCAEGRTGSLTSLPPITQPAVYSVAHLAAGWVLGGDGVSYLVVPSVHSDRRPLQVWWRECLQRAPDRPPNAKANAIHNDGDSEIDNDNENDSDNDNNNINAHETITIFQHPEAGRSGDRRRHSRVHLRSGL